ncbi:S-adenosyl-L-methionine-dependent methyltransferase [Obba rivulosa]|uniref:S-adenosyl-L-methionine-dependent methyltransferase n=1 Tax=Obba rivulosa TaxID=1052685 RepID=A0A8E2DGU6_9APHY|nr:S-adenosyl-L-methionine-dependent methyltransferase [Obba rivulosa]
MHILDVGCSQGTISTNLAMWVPQNRVTGEEHMPKLLDKARALAAERGVTSIEFKVGDVLALNFPDYTFDVVYVHKVLQYTGYSVLTLREMCRVAKPGSIVAAGCLCVLAFHTEICQLKSVRTHRLCPWPRMRSYHHPSRLQLALRTPYMSVSSPLTHMKALICNDDCWSVHSVARC